MAANCPIGKDVYFISLLGAEGEEGKPRPYPFVFDLVSRWYDFRNTNAIFVDVRALCDFYEKTIGKSSSDVDVYKLSLVFIQNHMNSHFIFDEVPIIKNDADGKNNFEFRLWT